MGEYAALGILAGLSARRFFNAGLKDLYDSCVLPVERPFPAAPNAVEFATYDRQTVHSAPTAGEAACTHRVFVPPAHELIGTCPDYSEPFAQYGTQGGAIPTRGGKRRKRERVGHLRNFAVRMWPTPEQTVELKRCFSASRHAYNATVSSINDGNSANFYERRAEFKATTKPEWASGVSYSIVAGGVKQAVEAFKSNYAKMRVDPSHTHFDVKFRSHRRTRTEVVHIDGDSVPGTKHSPLLAFRPMPFTNSDNRAECLAFFGCNLKAVGGIRLQDKARVIDKLIAEGRRLTNECKIHWDKRTRAFHFIYTYEIPRLADPDPEFENKRVVATDPGARRFQTFYSPTSGEVGILMQRGRREIERRCIDIDKRTGYLQRRRNREAPQPEVRPRTRKQRQRTLRNKSRRLAKERVRMTQWVKFFHYDSANFLLRNYDLVIAPKLKTADMVTRKNRVFGNKTARSMLTFSHGLFAQRLESAAARYAGRCVLTDTGEPGTSKTCTHCGKWKADLGGAEHYECQQCGAYYDRDVGGARNNFLAALGTAMGVGWDGQGGN
jgi:transposase